MAKRKRRKTSKRRRGKKQTWSWAGLVILLWSALSFFKLGLLGRQAANCLRFFTGDSYQFFAVVLAVLAGVMIIYNQPPRFGWRRGSGLVLLALGFLLCLSARFFDQLLVHHNFTSVVLERIGADFSRGQLIHPLGGGIIGAVLYSGLFPIISNLGAQIVGWLLIVWGLLLVFNIRVADVVTAFQHFAQLFIAKNQATGHVLRDRYHDLVESRKEEEQNNRAKLHDPLDDSDQTFPDLSDFSQNSNQESQPVDNELGSVPEPEDVPLPQENEPAAPEPEPTPPPRELPPSHSFADEDRQIEQKQAAEDKAAVPTQQASSNYQLPPLSLLDPVQQTDQSSERQQIKANSAKLVKTLASFGVKVTVQSAVLGPTVTRYEIRPAVGVKVSRIVNLADDLALALAAKDIRIEAPIPGKPLIGIEVPNRHVSAVGFKDVMEHESSAAKKDPLAVPLGKNVAGRVETAELAKMPHLLIAGSTGSGKSVAINTFITSILMKARPDEVKLVLIDPKMVELSVYNDVPHLLIPVVTDAKLAANALHKTVKEMERRYKLFAASGTRNMTEYNERARLNNQDKSKPVIPVLPYIVVIVDELSDLMMVAGHEVEDAIVRLAQLSRAAGIHMVLATQRPSVDVITGLIKANVPSRISFAVSSGVDSRTILDQVGAEKLLGRGDMLFMPIGASKPERIQGSYIGVDEIERVVAFIKKQASAEYDQSMMPMAKAAEGSMPENTEERDEYFDQAVQLVEHEQAASVSMLQRRFRIGYNRAARIIDQMEAAGIVGPSEGSKPRKVLSKPKEGADEHGQH